LFLLTNLLFFTSFFLL
jgi:hypothetical protein